VYKREGSGLDLWSCDIDAKAAWIMARAFCTIFKCNCLRRKRAARVSVCPRLDTYQLALARPSYHLPTVMWLLKVYTFSNSQN
jgi:hypothetical protein